MTVGELLERLDSRELTEWEAFDRLEPIDHIRRLELAAATVAQTLGNIHRDKNHDRFKASDFMVDWGADERAKTATAAAGEIPIADRIEDAMVGLGIRWETPAERVQGATWEQSPKQP